MLFTLAPHVFVSYIYVSLKFIPIVLEIGREPASRDSGCDSARELGRETPSSPNIEVVADALKSPRELGRDIPSRPNSEDVDGVDKAVNFSKIICL